MRSTSTWIRSGACVAAGLFLMSGAPRVGAAENASRRPKPAADDTGKNVRDADGGTLTPDQQSNDADDVALARRIRRSITKDGSLSTNAHNVKIITHDRTVTLRGPVNSEKERAAVVKKAQRIAGAAKVDDQLEVAKK